VGTGDFEVQSLSRLGLRELALGQEDTHGLSSLGYVWTTLANSRRWL
jgi:hypothetical protein